MLTHWDVLRVKHLMVSFSIPEWKQRLKSRKRALPGQIVFIKEDKELAQLRGMAETVGLANACYAVRYVLRTNVFSGQKHLRSLPWTSFHQGTHPWNLKVELRAACLLQGRSAPKDALACCPSGTQPTLDCPQPIFHVTLARNTSAQGKNTWCFPVTSKISRPHLSSP